MSSQPYYIGLFLFADQYSRGIDDVINLINTQFPDNTLTIEKYIVNGQIDNVISAVDDFLLKYPSGNRCTISTHTVTITTITTYLDELQIIMPNYQNLLKI